MNNVRLINNRTYWFDDLLFLIRSEANIFMTPTGNEIDIAVYPGHVHKFTVLQSSKGILILQRINVYNGNHIHKIISIVKDVDINVCVNEYESNTTDGLINLISAKRLLNTGINEFITGHRITVSEAMGHAQPYRPIHKYNLETFVPENVIHSSNKTLDEFWSREYGM